MYGLFTFCIQDDYSRNAMYITFCIIVSILGTVGNGLVIWITGFKMKKTMTTIWFLNLGIADFSFCLFLLLYVSDAELWAASPLDLILCKLSFFTLYLNQYASVLFLTVISIDRCVCVLCPIWSRNHRTSRLAAIISVIIWLLTITLSSPYFIFSNFVDDDFNFQCTGSNTPLEDTTTIDYTTLDLIDKATATTEFVSAFLIPFSIILVCYGLIAFTVRKNSRIPGSARTLKIITTTVICFFFCWVLYYMLPMINMVGPDTEWPGRNHLFELAQCLAFFNSCLNPIIYVFIGRDFKQVLRRSIPFLMESLGL
uniref:G-protein coupled receptors family 1 profile domain-containing protein n=1 Tax=Xenopus tropicalis TaxID=8364 RepID=A0A803K5R6_XENTR